MRALVALALAAPVLAGCIGSGNNLPDPPSRSLPLMAHNASGAHDVPAAFGDLGFSIHPTGYRRGEPTLGVTSDRTIFTVGEESNVLRSRDDGKSWQVLDDGVFGPPLDADPFLWVDPTTGRVFNSRLDGSVWLAWTNNQGVSWWANPAAVLRLADHQRLTTGPPPAGVSVNGYPSLLYLAYFSGVFLYVGTPEPDRSEDARRGTHNFRVAVSDDGGRTFTRDVPVFPRRDVVGTHASVAVADDGTAYLAMHTRDGVAVARSADGGASWERVADLDQPGPPHGAEAWVLDPMMDVDDAGNAYVVWQSPGGELWLSHSSDGGDTWSEPVLASPPSITSAVFPEIAAGADGRIAIAYIGTTTPDDDWDGARENDPSLAGEETVWHLYVGFLEDATAGNPLIVTLQVTPANDPVQRGCLDQDSDEDLPCKNLLDYMDMVEHEGNVYIAYPDGCDACATAEGSHVLGETTIVIQRGGPLLREVGRVSAEALGAPRGLGRPVEHEFTGQGDAQGCYHGSDPTKELAVHDHEPQDVDHGTWTDFIVNCLHPPTDFTLTLELP
ncbi:MAG: sialidase family protein [Methanobacteriota archaeon]